MNEKNFAIVFLTGFLFFAGCTQEKHQVGNGDNENTDDCISLQELKESKECLFAVGKTVYDMSEMMMWEAGGHVVEGQKWHGCGGCLSQEEMEQRFEEEGFMPHEGEHYFGPIVGELCESS